MGRIEHEPAKQALIQMLLENDDEDAYLRHAASLALARIGDSDLLINLKNHDSDALRLAAVIALRRMSHPGVAEFLADRNVSIVRDAARAINDDFSIPDALDDLGAILNKTPYQDEVIIRRSINANLRVGTPDALGRLMSYAMNNENPTAMRSDALHVITHWSNPSVLDRVDGRFRGAVQRPIAIVQELVSEQLGALFADQNPEIRINAVALAGINKVNSVQLDLASLLEKDPSSDVRRAAIRSLIQLNPPQLKTRLGQALEDEERIVRVAALEGIKTIEIPNADKLSLLEPIIFNQSIPERQAAIATLSQLPITISKSTFEKLLAQWREGKLMQEIRLDVAEAIGSTDDAQLDKLLNAVQSQNTNSDDVLAAYKDCISGGDPSKGNHIVWNHTGAQCTRCHEMYDYGGIAGPPLTTIADQLSPEQLLASLVQPSARIATGYGMVSLFLNNDDEVDGMLIEEDDMQLKIRNASNEILIIQKSEINERIDAVSSMPNMSSILSKQEIRDLMAYLLTLKSSS